MEKLSPQEEVVMQAAWRVKMGAVRDIMAEMPDKKPPYTTVASIVKNLEKKLFLTGRKFGNTYVYTPLISEEKYKSRFMSQFVSRYFENSYKNMVSFFAEKEKISAEDLKDIIEIIERGEAK
ncbi:MAG: transcriptional regulator [Bacteroidia bacterium]|nr:MAG: transcriptional regulator [Bacteroidia bacterium]